MRAKEFIVEKWSQKYKRSINCANPRGFSQRAHCQGRKKKKVRETGLYYRGYPCTKDCSGHTAGYAWAISKNAQTYADCGNPWSNSFWEGCKSKIEGK